MGDSDAGPADSSIAALTQALDQTSLNPGQPQYNILEDQAGVPIEQQDVAVIDPQLLNTGKFQVSDYPTFLANLQSPDQTTVYRGLVGIRKVLSSGSSTPIGELHKIPGASAAIVGALTGATNVKIIFEALWCCANLCSDTKAICQDMINLGVLDATITFIQHSNPSVVEQALWMLETITGDSRDSMFVPQYFDPYLKVVQSLCNRNWQRISILRTLIWTISNLCRGKPSPPYEFVSQFLPSLERVLFSDIGDAEVTIDIMWSLSYLTDHKLHGEQVAGILIEHNITQTICSLLLSQNQQIITPALRTIGNIISSSDPTHTQALLEQGILDVLITLIRDPALKAEQHKEAAWTISNIAAGTSEQVTFLARSDAFKALHELVPTANAPLKKEIFYCAANLVSPDVTNEIAIKALISIGWVKTMIADLDANPKSAYANVILQALGDILAYGNRPDLQVPHLIEGKKVQVNLSALMIQRDGGVNVLEKCQDFPELHNMAVELLQTYWAVSSDEEAEQSDPSDPATSEFTFG